MIQKYTQVSVSDGTLAQWVRVFHLYGGFQRHWAPINYYVKGSIRILKPAMIYYKGFQTKRLYKGKIIRGLVIQSVYRCLYQSSNNYYFKSNNILLIKKKHIFLSKYIISPGSRCILNKRIRLLFASLL
jgi:ribosomal protein L14